MQLESKGLLDAHLKEHKLPYQCDVCYDRFSSKVELREHVLSEHEQKDWTCYDCSFQTSNSKELMTHLKLTGHQPSREIHNAKSTITQCYTCKE